MYEHLSREYYVLCFTNNVRSKPQFSLIESSILDNLKATVASITDIHDKDIEEVTETLCDVATKLNSIQNGSYWLHSEKVII